MKIWCVLISLLLFSCAHLAESADQEKKYLAKIDLALHPFMDDFAECYNQEYTQVPYPKGKIKLAWFVDDIGSAQSVYVSENDFNRTFANCFVDVFKRIKFPVHESGAKRLSRSFEFNH